MTLETLLASVAPLSQEAMAAARQRQAALAKPPESLGRLEELSVQLAGITGKVHNSMDKTHLLVFAADNGVVEEGVSSAPQSVTLMQTINLTRAKTGASVLAKHFGSGITVCDVGVNAVIQEPKVLNKKIAFGTQNIAKGPAMTREQAIQAILTGAELAMQTEADAMGVGEMGIGNTTTSSAVLSVLLGVSVETVTGRGGGITDDSFRKKKQVIADAIALNKPNPSDPVDVLQKVGGFDLAAMCGAFLGGAASHRPMVIDGFISAVAALCAVRLCPAAGDYLVPSHASYEIGYKLAMEAMGLEPIFLLGMRLGEGSGCPWPSRCSAPPVPSSTTWPPLIRRALTMAIWMKSGKGTSSPWRQASDRLHYRGRKEREVLLCPGPCGEAGFRWEALLPGNHDSLRRRGQ